MLFFIVSISLNELHILYVLPLRVESVMGGLEVGITYKAVGRDFTMLFILNFHGTKSHGKW